MTNLSERFTTAAFEQRLALATDPGNYPELHRLLGEQALDEYRLLASAIDDGHLSSGPAANIVFLPGVMGSSLASTGLGGIWWLDIASRRHINDLGLNEDGVSDADPRAGIEPVSLMSQYEAFLAATFGTDDLRHVAVPYDWRKGLQDSAHRIRTTILDTAEKHRAPVHLVAHSMGGLLARTTLMMYPELWTHVDRIVFIGTPHYGSPAIAGYLKNHLWGFELLALLGRYLDRETFRTLRGVLSLLPAPDDIYPGAAPGSHPCANFDMYDAEAWHLKLSDGDLDHLQTTLDAVASLHRELHTWHIALDPELRERMAAIVGVGHRTLFRIAYHEGFGFGWREMDRITRRTPGDPHRDGDGRVPIASAALRGIGEIRYVRGEHGRLPTLPSVYLDTFNFLRGRPMYLPRSVAEALDADHLADPGAPSPTPALSSPGVDTTGEDPGYLDLTEVSESRLRELDAAAEAEQLPHLLRIRLL